MLGIRIKEPKRIDWDNSENLASGIFNIFYEDEKANQYDRTGKLSDADREYLTQHIGIIQDEIRRTYPEQDSEISMFIGKICSFRNLFKKARYGGFHHDRELETIRKYEQLLPEYGDIYRECLDLRRRIFPNRLLGELKGWNGIRKERKRLWIEKGLTGVEQWI